jgi:hypothetical protein
LDDYTLLADIGCGNGKYLKVAKKNIIAIGMDRSEGIIIYYILYLILLFYI